MTDPRTAPHSLRDRRRLAIAHSATQRGLDHIGAEPWVADPTAASGENRFRLRLYFVPTAPQVKGKAAIPPGLVTNNLRISVAGGGDPGLRIVEIRGRADLPEAAEADGCAVRFVAGVQ